MTSPSAAPTVRVWVSDAASGLGRRVTSALGTPPNGSPTGPSQTGPSPAGPSPAGLEPAGLELAGVAECDVMVWLTAANVEARARRHESATEGITAALVAAGHARHVVLVSSAMVYGAYANNPVPLTEDAALRPDVEFAFARQLGAVEQLVDEWRLDAPGRSVTVLRPALAMAADGTTVLARALAAGMGQRAGEDDPPAQFLHLDDLASATVLAARRELDGVFNVAPDGWVLGERVRALAGAVPRVKLPERLTEVISGVRWRFQRGPIPPGLRSYTRSPWMVANDRLKAQGWQPTVTNEQAYVEGTEAKWWTMVTPKRRQEITLAGSGAIVAGAALAIWRAAARIRRSRQTR